MMLCTHAQTSPKTNFHLNYDPLAQTTSAMNYFKPEGNLFVGDCIPFYHDSTFYLYWLLDSGHHSALNGMGGHQWVLSTSRDLKSWKHYPVVLGIDEDWEKSICTGSVVYHNDTFYAFYATRLATPSGEWREQLSYAVSKDGIHYKKQKPNPFYTSAPGYSKRHFRDAKVSIDSAGNFHLFVTSAIENSGFHHNGALVHMVSADLKNWELKEPVITGMSEVPECPDYFYWNGWYYLLYSTGSETYYVMSRHPYGPWQYPPAQVFREEWSNVVKTAPFGAERRIAAGWVPSRLDNKDGGPDLFGGNTVLREIVQNEDGTLYTKFVPEMIPATGEGLPVRLSENGSVSRSGSNYTFDARHGLTGSFIKDVPANCRITMEIEPLGSYDEYGLYLRANEDAGKGYKLAVSANESSVTLADTRIAAVDGLGGRVKLDIVMKDDIIDVNINGRRCIVNRLIDHKGHFLWLYAKFGRVIFHSVKIAPLKK